MTEFTPGADMPETEGPRYTSFILRCWQDSAPSLDGEAHLRARLVDVNSGVSYPLTDLSELPTVLRRLLRQMVSGKRETT